MPLGTGYKMKCGIAKQSAWDTLVAPVEFAPILPGESLNKMIQFAEQDVLKSKGGREVADVSGIIANGSIPFEANYQETDLLWALLFGGVTTISGTSPYEHVIPIADEIARSISLHIEKDVNVWSAHGLKINTATFVCSPDNNPATLECEFVARDIDQDTTHRTALTNLVDPEKPRLLWHECTMRLGDLVNALDSSDEQDVSSISFKVNRNLATEHRDATSGLYIIEPFVNGRREITLELIYPRYKVDQIRTWQVARTLLQADITFTVTIGSTTYIWLLELPTLVVKEFSAPGGDEGILPVTAMLQCYRNQGNTSMSGITEEAELTITNDRDAAIWT